MSDDIVVDIIDERPDIEVTIITGEQGPPGDSYLTFVKMAGEVISGHRMVALDNAGLVVYSSGVYPVGLSLNAALLAGSVTIQSAGKVEEPSWDFTPGLPIYQTGRGYLTQQIPSLDGFILEVGKALSKTSVLIEIKMPIILGG